MFDSPPVASRPLTVRAAITNNPLALRGLSGRSAEARRYRDLVIAFADDLGGVDKLGEADRALVRQAAAKTIESDDLAAAVALGERVDPEQSVRVANVLSRLLRQLERRAKAKAPATSSPLAQHFSRPPTRETT